MEEEKPHVRRKRYSGTHPTRYEERYKELDPEKYASEVEKIRASGHTPAGTHIPIMADEILEFLEIRPGMTGLDATLGYGGHTRLMMERLMGEGHHYACDVDPIESVKTEARLREAGFGPEIFTVRRVNFADLETIAPGVRYDYVLADLGVSSMQIDNPERGFTFKAEGPLDLRMDPTSGVPASGRLLELTYPELVDMMRTNSDEPYAEEIARGILRAVKKGEAPETTTALAKIVEAAVEKALGRKDRDAARKSCQRVFQALRIEVNSEFEVLRKFLAKLPGVLTPGGRAAILTFHSGEDRLVKKAFKAGTKCGIYSSSARDVIRPSEEECRGNSRAHSTKLRWAIRSDEPAPEWETLMAHTEPTVEE